MCFSICVCFVCAFSWDKAVFGLFFIFQLSHNINLTNEVNILKDLVLYPQCLILQSFHCQDVFFYLCLFLCAFSWDTAVFWLFSFFLLSHNINLKNKVNNIIMIWLYTFSVWFCNDFTVWMCFSICVCFCAHSAGIRPFFGLFSFFYCPIT